MGVFKPFFKKYSTFSKKLHEKFFSQPNIPRILALAQNCCSCTGMGLIMKTNWLHIRISDAGLNRLNELKRCFMRPTIRFLQTYLPSGIIGAVIGHFVEKCFQ